MSINFDNAHPTTKIQQAKPLFAKSSMMERVGT